MNLVIQAVVIVYVILTVIATGGAVYRIGQPREPLTPGVFIAHLVITAIVVALLLNAYF